MKNIFKKIGGLLLIALVLITVTACSSKSNSIVGKWKYETGDYTYTFNEDGSGSYDTPLANMTFTYTVDHNKISILYTGNTAPFETEYEINDNKLNIIDSFGNDTIYIIQ